MQDLAEAMDLGTLVGQGVPNEPGEEVGKKAGPLLLPDDFTLLSKPSPGTLYRNALHYLVNRHVSFQQIREKKIGVSLTGRYAYRIVFPVYYGRKLQGIVTRDFTGQQDPKYLNSPGMKAVYNSPAKTKRKTKAVLTEGIFDCLSVERALALDNYDVLALLGHGLTDMQEERLAGYRDITLWPDADVPGVEGFVGIAKHLMLQHRVSMVLPKGEGKDPGELGINQVRDLWFERREPFTESLELRLRAEVSLRD